MSCRIEVCGGIASGKTSLARVLEQEGFFSIYERFGDNPFLNEFYQEKGIDNTLETELVFVLLHYNRIKANYAMKNIVCDYSLFQDYCYGVNNLDGEDIELFHTLYNHLLKQIPSADLIIYLKCGVECLLERIRMRNREMEQNISQEYLQDNIEVIERYLSTQNNVLIIESDKYNFIEKDKENVVTKIFEFCKERKIVL